MNTITEIEVVAVYKNLGFTESITSCDCCGRIDLKGTYAIENTLTGEIAHLGCVCAASRMKWSKKEFTNKYKAEVREQEIAARREYNSSPEMKAKNSFVEDYLAARNVKEDGSDLEFDTRHEAIKSAEYQQRKINLDFLKAELFKKYPLCKYIY